MDNSNVSSFLSANEVPWKILRSHETVRSIRSGMLPLLHAQVVPTNKCNGGCRWCSCSREDRTVEVSDDKLHQLSKRLADEGCRAITITGGGEPTLHPGLVPWLRVSKALGMKLGMVTNGIIWGAEKGSAEGSECLTWLRLSITDTESGRYDLDRMSRICQRLRGVDIGISFTVSQHVSVQTAVAVTLEAHHRPNCTHVRFVEDILNPCSDRMDAVRDACQDISSKAIFQYRSQYVPGSRECYWSLVKPVFAADGYVYPCCGVQYAQPGDMALAFPKEWRMGTWDDFFGATKPLPFNGLKCARCYYAAQNNAISMLRADMVHEEFI